MLLAVVAETFFNAIVVIGVGCVDAHVVAAVAGDVVVDVVAAVAGDVVVDVAAVADATEAPFVRIHPV